MFILELLIASITAWTIHEMAIKFVNSRYRMFHAVTSDKRKDLGCLSTRRMMLISLLSGKISRVERLVE